MLSEQTVCMSVLTGLVSRVLTVGCFCFVVTVVDSLNFICFEGGENISSEANNDKSLNSLTQYYIIPCTLVLYTTDDMVHIICFILCIHMI